MTAVAAPESSKLTAPNAIPVAPAQPDVKVATERAVIDAAASGPVLTFFLTSIGWLLVSSLLGLISSIKLVKPEFLAGCSFLTYGRITPAYQAALTYGWASLAGMGVAIWLMSRLCRVSIRYPGVLKFGIALWNLGLALGILCILLGKSTGIEGMEIPFGSAAIMFAGYVLIGVWGAILYRFRRNAPAYISVWYLLGAFFWFPWFFGISYLLNTFPGLNGVMHNVVAAWYSQNLSLLWFTAIGLATAYYLIPKVINRPIYSYNLASLGFWTFALFGGLTASVRLSGGPVPAWLVTVGIAANLLLLVPIVTVMTNFVFTMRGHTKSVYYSPTIRFTFFGVVVFGITSALSLFSSLRGVDRYLHFTQFASAQQHLLLYTFFSMVMFGAIYYVTPRLVGCEWPSSTLIKFHFYLSSYGGGILVCTLALSGLATGYALISEDATYAQIIQSGQVYMAGTCLAYLILGLGHLIFLLHFLLMLLRIGNPGAEPTLFATPGEDHH